MPGWEYERAASAAGRLSVCGCDEAGVGPLAGRVYAAAVILPDGLELPYLDDSKKVSEKRREAVFNQIRDQAAAWSVAWVEPKEIDEIDILNSRIKAMQMAIDETMRRREIQMTYNQEHGITPQTIKKAVRDLISISQKVDTGEMLMEKDVESMSREELEKTVEKVTKQMKKAAAELNFEAAAELRDQLIELKKALNDMKTGDTIWE